MSIGFHLVEHAFDVAVTADQERCTLDAECRLAVHVLLFDYVVGFANLLVGVGQEREWQVVLLGELLLLVG